MGGGEGIGRRQVLGMAMLAGTLGLSAGRAAPASDFRAFADLAYRQKRPAEAYAEFVDPGLIQHNPRMRDGRAAALEVLEGLYADPAASFDVSCLLRDGPFAFVHYHGRMDGKGPSAAVAELFRLSGGKAVEHWDAFQPVPSTAANPHPMFGTLPPGLPPVLQGARPEDRRMVLRFVDLFYRQKKVAEAFDAFVAPDYVQHNPGIADGRSAAVAALSTLFARPSARFDVRHVLVAGDRAVVHLHGRGGDDGPGAAVFDVYRFAGGRMREHWDVIQPLQPGSINPRSPV